MISSGGAANYKSRERNQLADYVRVTPKPDRDREHISWRQIREGLGRSHVRPVKRDDGVLTGNSPGRRLIQSDHRIASFGLGVVLRKLSPGAEEQVFQGPRKSSLEYQLGKRKKNVVHFLEHCEVFRYAQTCA